MILQVSWPKFMYIIHKPPLSAKMKMFLNFDFIFKTSDVINVQTAETTYPDSNDLKLLHFFINPWTFFLSFNWLAWHPNEWKPILLFSTSLQLRN